MYLVDEGRWPEQKKLQTFHTVKEREERLPGLSKCEARTLFDTGQKIDGKINGKSYTFLYFQCLST